MKKYIKNTILSLGKIFILLSCIFLCVSNVFAVEKATESTIINKGDMVLDALDEVAVWYVNHIPTQKGKWKSLKATKQANKFYYPIRKKIIKSNGKNLYHYEPFEKFGIKDYFVQDKNVNKDKNIYNYTLNANCVGDDCSGLVLATILTMSNGDRGNIEENGKHKENHYGFYLNNTNAEKFLCDENGYKVRDDGKKEFIKGGKNIYNAMTNLGFKRCEAKDIAIDKLLPGDILVSDNHMEIYVGYEYDITYIDNNAQEGIESVIRKKSLVGIDDFNVNHCTFSWGNVRNEYPKHKFGFYKDGDNFRMCFSCKDGKHVDCKKYDTNVFKVLWRYDG